VANLIQFGFATALASITSVAHPFVSRSHGWLQPKQQ
jgi:hypothetical protein